MLRLVSRGWTNRTVARTLWVTDETVKFHLSNIYRKLGVSNRAEASLWAAERGIADTGDRDDSPGSTHELSPYWSVARNLTDTRGRLTWGSPLPQLRGEHGNG